MTTPALCGASDWVCPSGYAEAEDCAPLAAACDGGPIADAGSEVDGGVDGGGSSIDYDGCDLPSDCALVPTTCCGVCGSPTIDDVAAIRGELSDAYYANVSCPESRDGPVPCPGCAGIPNPSLIAACTLSRGGTACSVVDLTEAPFTECGSNADCVLTTPQCCACGEIDAWQTIAVASSSLGRLNALLCDTDAPCPPCVPTFDPTLTPVCSSGRCEVIGPADP